MGSHCKASLGGVEMTEIIITVENLTVNYKEISVLNHISLSLEKGKVYGLVGENGSGKSTLIGYMLGLLPWERGNITLFNKPISFSKDKNYVFSRCSAVLQDVALPKRLTVKECLSLFSVLGNGQKDMFEIIHLLHLENQIDKKFWDLSFGQKQRVLIGTALLQEFDILFLDEPTNGLDKETRENLFSVIETLRGQGKTIIFISHREEEVNRICDEILLISHGKIRIHNEEAS